MKLFTALATAAIAFTSVGCAETQQQKVERIVSSTPVCQPEMLAKVYKEVIAANGSVIEAGIKGLGFGQNKACGEKAAAFMLANPAEYQQVLEAMVKHDACMKDAFACN